MKAAVYTRYGSPDVVHLEDVDLPVPTEHEVRVKVRATTVNRTDCGWRKGDPIVVRLFSGLRQPKRTILGSEFAGEIDAVGSAVTSFSVGDQVFGVTGNRFGAHAQFLCVPEDGSITTKPNNMSFEEAASVCDGAMLAWSCLKKADIQQRKDVLIYGSSGSIGTAAVQLAKHFGAEITAVCGTRNLELVKNLGADTVIDYTKEDFTKISRIYDVVFDAVGKSSYSRCRSLLKPDGAYIATDLGFLFQNPFFALLTSKFGSKKALFPIPNHSKHDIIFFKELIETGHLRPVIDRRYQLEEIADAYRYAETGHKTGNLVITMKEESSANATHV